MKQVLLSTALFAALAGRAQTITQPIASGDYWKTEEYASRLPELVNKTTFPTTFNFTNGYAGITALQANRLIGVNEVIWNLGAVQNVSGFVVEWSRDLVSFERAGVVQLARTEGSSRYVFKHLFQDNQLVYYRLGFQTAGTAAVAYTPAVQVLDEESVTKVFPTQVRGGNFYVQTAQTWDKLQVFNSANSPVLEKGISGQTGTITVSLPSLPTGIYFVRLLGTNKPQHVQRILVE